MVKEKALKELQLRKKYKILFRLLKKAGENFPPTKNALPQCGRAFFYMDS